MGNREVLIPSLLPFHDYSSLSSLPCSRRTLENLHLDNSQKKPGLLIKARLFSIHLKRIFTVAVHDSDPFYGGKFVESPFTAETTKS